jgi:cysteine-S-conjugate beta-lyase
LKYDFNKIIERRNTKSVKWDLGEKDVLPMWVADMDFEVPEVIVNAIIKRAKHPIYGYTTPRDEYYNSIIKWWKERHNYNINKEWIVYSPGVVPAVNMLIKAFTNPGDKVILQTPVYHPFFSAVKSNGCEIIENPLKLVDNKYYMDFEDLEHKLKDFKVKAIVLCSPHNPVGRVWTREELTNLGELCLKHGVIVISDEIHCDIVYKDYKHIPFPSISDEFAESCAMCTAPSKTFNLAGLQVSSIIISNDTLRNKFSDVLESNGIETPNIFGIEALEAAYNHGRQWLDQLIDYLKGNLEFLTKFIEKNTPEIKVIQPEGTYLVWIDCRELNMNPKELNEFFLKNAKVWFNEGYIFGNVGDGFQRVNIACPRSVLEEALMRIDRALKNI